MRNNVLSNIFAHIFSCVRFALSEIEGLCREHFLLVHPSDLTFLNLLSPSLKIYITQFVIGGDLLLIYDAKMCVGVPSPATNIPVYMCVGSGR